MPEENNTKENTEMKFVRKNKNFKKTEHKQETSSMGEIKKLGKESAIYGISNVLSRFLNFFLTPFYTYFLPTGAYGIVAGVYSYIAFLNILYHYALDQAYMQYFGNRQQAFSAALKFQAGTTAFLTFALCAFAPFWANLGGIAAKYVYFASAILVLDTVLIIPFADLQMRHQSKKFAIIKSLGIILNVLIIVAAIACFKCGIDSVFWANIVSSLLQIILILPEFKLFSIKKDPGAKELLKKMLEYAWPLFLAEAGIMIVQVFDRPIMLKAMGESAVGVYQAAAKLGIFMQLLVNMFYTAWRPFVIERRGKDDAETRRLFSKIFTYSTAFTLSAWLLLSFFVGDIVQFKVFGKSFFNANYWGGIKLLPLFFGSYVIYGMYINLLSAVLITKKSKVSAIVAITSSLLSLAGNYLLIPRLGMSGGAIMLIVSYSIMCGMMLFFSRKIYPVRYEWRRIAILFAAAAACFAPAVPWYLSLWGFNMSAGLAFMASHAMPIKILCAIIFPAAIWNLGFFSITEKNAIKDYLQKRFGKYLRQS